MNSFDILYFCRLNKYFCSFSHTQTLHCVSLARCGVRVTSNKQQQQQQQTTQESNETYFCHFISDMLEGRVQIAEDTFLLQRPKKYTYHNNYAFVFERQRLNSSYYHCAEYRTFKCRTRLVVGPGTKPSNREYKQFKTHNHSPRHNAKRNTLPFQRTPFCILLIQF